MASNRHASFEGTLEDTHQDTYGPQGVPGSPGPYPAYFGPKGAGTDSYGEWNPGEDTVRPVRGRHRVARQRGGTIARSRAVLGVGVIAAVGAGGMATANEDGAATVPGMDAAADKVGTIPVLGSLLGGPGAEETTPATPFTSAGITGDEGEAGHTDAGEALRARILQQADQAEAGADAQARTAAVQAAEAGAAEQAAEAAEAERAAEEERRRQEAEERRQREEEERLRQLRASYTLPLSDYRISSQFGQSGAMWQSTHTGTDFSASTGTPVKNVHTGVVQEAAWAGSYGYRVIVELEDGTEIWYCHLSSMSVSAGQEVVTGESVGRVGSTGNSSGPHLHLEVLPDGETAIDPLPWLRGKGLSI
ncbi:M23 family metallopeptidase [Streptomyces johnsoniae]|uniref:M23 family metallopeptidase n=1 Tax=Streptomyces johnsoniae TaxID=3075532 RepID=A0ABU2SE97_9ACTN|nr:M23 family metallopeptidase [Streptomyces sp. DSM 41886]MDT0447291.1 M23 family metallopeptidase [Streptomyces sp. DSM 41886]